MKEIPECGMCECHIKKKHDVQLLDTHFERALQKKKRRSFEGPLFTGRDKKRVSEKTMYNRITNILKKCHLPEDLTPHSFRRACATNLYIETKDLLFVRDYLNHHDAKVTQTYIDSSQLNKKEEVVHPELMFPKLSSQENLTISN